MLIPNLLLIAGTGTKSGKTTFACRLIEQLQHPGLVAIKITPHFHETTPGLVLLHEGEGWSVYRENNPENAKDTSRLLKAGASEVYFAKVSDNTLLPAFNKIIKDISPETPVICESPALRHYVTPGLFIIMSSDSISKQKDINNLLRLPHVSYKIEELESTETIPVIFSDGKWIFSGII